MRSSLAPRPIAVCCLETAEATGARNPVVDVTYEPPDSVVVDRIQRAFPAVRIHSFTRQDANTQTTRPRLLVSEYLLEFGRREVASRDW